MKRSKTKNVITKKVTSSPARMRSLTIVGLVAGLILGLGIAAYAANTMLHGHVRITEHRNPAVPANAATEATNKPSSVKTPAAAPVAAPELIAKYGPAAKSQKVAAAITKLEPVEPAPGAKAAADRYEALAHGYWRPGADPMQAIMAGYVPPGMPPEQAAMLYNSLPNNLRMQPGLEPGSPEWVARMAREPADPIQSVLAAQGLSPNQISAQNDQIIQKTMHDRFGPIYVPPLHRDHNHAAEPAMAAASIRLVQAHQGSIREMTDDNGNIVAQYAYDPYGNATKLQGSLDSDFGYAGYYVHQPSGLLLTQTRAYSPALGRFINRDPIGERGGRNLYAYVGNNPIGRSDPSGLQGIGIGIGLGTATAPSPLGSAVARPFNVNPYSGEPLPFFIPEYSPPQPNYYWPGYIGPWASESSCKDAALQRYRDCRQNPGKYPNPKSQCFKPGSRVNSPNIDPDAQKCLQLYDEWLNDCESQSGWFKGWASI